MHLPWSVEDLSFSSKISSSRTLEVEAKEPDFARREVHTKNEARHVEELQLRGKLQSEMYLLKQHSVIENWETVLLKNRD